MAKLSRGPLQLSLFMGVLGALTALLLLEKTHPLRPKLSGNKQRRLQNLSLWLLGIGTTQMLNKYWPSLQSTEPNNQHPPKSGLQSLITLMLLDYTLYLWHGLNHRLPILWRFHRVHHADPELDATTASRFHLIELLLGSLWRAGQIRLLKVTARELTLWQSLLQISIYFHHANLHLPPQVEQGLSRWLITPRLHAVHHSNQLQQSQRNFSAGLMIWDHLHRTYQAAGPDEPMIGLADQHAIKQTLASLLLSPFRKPQP